METQKMSPEAMVQAFFEAVWRPPAQLNIIDDLMTEDYEIITAGTSIKGRDKFKAWVQNFHRLLLDASNVSHDIIVDKSGEKVVSRWTCSGKNNGIFGLKPDRRAVSFTGIAIWQMENGRFSKCWVERSALETYLSDAK